MRRLIAVALVVLAAAPACGLGEREGYADLVAASTGLAIDQGTVSGTLSASMRIVKAPLDLPPDAMSQTIDASTTFVADLASRRSLLQDQQLVHDDLVVHLRRADAEAEDARPWLTLDVRDLDEDASLPFSNSDPVRMPYTLFAIPPAVLIDLVAGALTGSLESIGTEEIEGVPVRGYRANFDLEKMLNDTREDAYDDEHREAVERTFETLDIDSTVHPGTVWLDGEGRPRRVAFELESAPRRRWAFGMTVTIDLVEWGAPAVIDLPTIEETIRISSISRLMTELARSFPVPTQGFTVPGGGPTPSTVPTEQPAPEQLEVEQQPAPEQPAPEQPAPEQPAPEEAP